VASAVRRRERERERERKGRKKLETLYLMEGKKKLFFPRSGFEDSEAVTARSSGGSKSEIRKSPRK
jgi:hypothetical protein